MIRVRLSSLLLQLAHRLGKAIAKRWSKPQPNKPRHRSGATLSEQMVAELVCELETLLLQGRCMTCKMQMPGNFPVAQLYQLPSAAPDWILLNNGYEQLLGWECPACQQRIKERQAARDR